MTNEYGNLELHQVLLAAMKDIDKICREKGLKYFLHAGTLLGAVNHGGFIPWDDDADISMFPDDYAALIGAINHEYSDRYSIKDYDNTPEHYSKLNKLQIIGAEVVYSDGHSEPVFIDISLLHPVPDSKFEQWIQCKELVFWDRVLGVKAKKIVPSSLAAKLILVPFSHISKEVIGKRLDRVMYRFEHRKTRWYALMIHMLDNPYTGVNGYYNDFVPREICENPKRIPFEDTALMVYSDPAVDLVRRYGEDYWKPYPEEKRVSKHDIVSYRLSDALKRRIISTENGR